MGGRPIGDPWTPRELPEGISWATKGRLMDYPRGSSGSSMGCPWTSHGQPTGYPHEPPMAALDTSRDTDGRCVGYPRATHAPSMGNLWASHWLPTDS